MIDKDVLQELYRYSFSLTCDEHSAYDLLQTSIEKFIRSNVSAKNITAYMKKIIYNNFVDDCRRQKTVQFENLEEAELPADFDVKTLEELLVSEEMVEQILQSLEPDEREIMYCWAIEGFSTSEIATKLEKPKGTILSKIYRMRKKLTEQFSDCSNVVMEAEK